MSEISYWNPMVPELSVTNFEVTLNFYLLCGFAVRHRRENPSFAYLEVGGVQLMLEEVHDSMWKTGALDRPLGRGVNFQIEIDDVKFLSEKLIRHDVELFRPLQESWYQVGNEKEGQLEFLVQDPDGYLLRFIEVIKKPT